LPEIRLVTDLAAIEYGPVHFQSHGLDMWLPRTAEIYYDWIGRRSHRLHRFDNYLLFSVDDKQRISVPKTDVPASSSPGLNDPQTPYADRRSPDRPSSSFVPRRGGPEDPPYGAQAHRAAAPSAKNLPSCSTSLSFWASDSPETRPTRTR